MLDLGFIHDIKQDFSHPAEENSGTIVLCDFSLKFGQLAKGLVNNPVEISVTPRTPRPFLVENGYTQ